MVRALNIPHGRVSQNSVIFQNMGICSLGPRPEGGSLRAILRSGLMQFKFTQIRHKGRPVGASRICRRLVAASIPLCLCVSLAFADLPAQAADANFNAAVKTYAAGKYAQALAQFQVVAQTYPSDPLTRYYMGLCYQHTNQVSQATQMYTWVEQNARSPQLKAQARAGLD